MILYVALLTSLLSLLVLAMVYLADFWEREPLDLIQNAFLTGLGTQLVLVLGFHRLAGTETWSGGLQLLTLGTLAIVLPILLAGEKEVDERFDGIVYSIAFAVGAASVVHLFNLPGAAAPFPERAVLGGGAAPGARDLLLLASAPGPRAELADLLALLLVSAMMGAVLGVLALGGRPLGHQVGGMLVTALALGGTDFLTGGWWPVRLGLAAAAVATGILLKRRSVFRGRQSPPERDIFLGALKTALMIFGAIVLSLALLLSLTDRWDTPPAPPAAEHLETGPTGTGNP